MTWFKGLEDIRKVEWSKSWLWDIKIPDGPPEFRQWFPATDIVINNWSLDTYNFAGGTTTFEIPKNSSLYNMRITFVDDIDHHISKWLTGWVDEITEGGNIQTLSECCKKIEVMKLRNRGEVVKGYPKTYWVFPKGSMDYNGNSEAEVHKEEVEFIICGQEE